MARKAEGKKKKKLTSKMNQATDVMKLCLMGEIYHL
jgi:hypothetical protein